VAFLFETSQFSLFYQCRGNFSAFLFSLAPTI